MNTVYSILLKGVAHDAPLYQRKVDTSIALQEFVGAGSILMPPTEDPSYENYQAEQLVQICRKSRLKGSLEAFDPFNTYEHVFDKIEPITTIGALPPDIYIDILEPSIRHTWAYNAVTLQVRPDGTAVVNGKIIPYTKEDELTTILPVADKLVIKIRGAFNQPFTTSLLLQRQPQRNIQQLDKDLRALQTVWLPQYEEYRNTPDINDFLAAFTLNYCESNYVSS